jgi:hypothetical protein
MQHRARFVDENPFTNSYDCDGSRIKPIVPGGSSAEETVRKFDAYTQHIVPGRPMVTEYGLVLLF